jgi:voltage-gated sodium channel
MSGVVSSVEEPVEYGRFGRMAQVARSVWFARFVIAAIAITGILSGLETYPAFRRETLAAALVDGLQNAVLAVFVFEIIVKIASFGVRPWRYFRAGWNVFDFAIVAVCLMPLNAEYVVVFRLLRTLRLFTALPGLQVLVSGLLRGIPALGYVGLLLLLHFYIYAVIGTFAFGANDPIRFGNLHTSMLTLFQVLTLEGWNDILATQYHGSEVGYDEAWKQLASGGRVSVAHPVAAALYFISFILIGTMIMLNLFTGVIIKSMEEAHIESAEAAHKRRLATHGVPEPRAELQQLSELLQAMAKRLAAIDPAHEPPAASPSGAVDTENG